MLKTRTALLFVTLVALTPALFAENYGGPWTKKNQTTNGTWEITKDGDVHVLRVSNDFKTRRAPDLKLFLSPLEAAQTSNDNATEGALFLGRLPATKGSFEIALPEGTRIEDYRSVLIHCEQYSKLWSAGKLRSKDER